MILSMLGALWGFLAHLNVVVHHHAFMFLMGVLSRWYELVGSAKSEPSPQFKALEFLVRLTRPRKAKIGLSDFRKSVEGYKILNYWGTNTMVNNIFANGVPCLYILSAPEPNPKHIIYLHGGGFCAGSPEAYHGMIAPIGRRCHCNVLAVKYRLAPEFPLPAGINDAVQAYRWLIETREVDPAAIVFMGDSAGGALCLLALLAIKQEGLEMPAGAALFSPYVDLTTSTESWRRNRGRDFILEPRVIDAALDTARKVAQGRPQDYSPYFLDAEGVKGLPPLFISASKDEPLIDEVVGFVSTAKSAGVDVTFEAKSSLPHVYPIFYKFCPEAAATMDNIVQWSKQRLGIPADYQICYGNEGEW